MSDAVSHTEGDGREGAWCVYASDTDLPMDGASNGAEHGQLLELYLEFSPRLVRQLKRHTGCLELARELTHETFLRLLLMTPAGLREIKHPEAYLRRIAINLVHEWGRKRALHQRLRASLELASEEQLDQITMLESRDTLRRVEHVIGKLKPKTREIFLAHRIEGFRYSEIATRTGLSIKGVEKQMMKAIAPVRRLRNGC